MLKDKVEKPIDWLARLGKTSKVPFGMMDILIATFFINILSLVMPLSLLQIYDRILPNETLNTLALLVSGIVLALLFESALRIGRSYLSGWVGARFEHMAGCAAVERLLSTSVNEFEKDGSGVHLERLSSLGTLKEFYAGQAIMTLFDLPFSIVFLALISYLAGSLVFVPICLIALFALMAWRIGDRLRDAISERMIADERRFNFIIEVLTGIHTLKSMAMETQMLRRYERLQESCARTDYDVTLHSSSAMSLGALYSQLTMFAVVGFGSTFVIDGQLTVGGLAACTMLSGRAMQPLQRAVGIWARFQSIQLARGKLREVFEMQPETHGSLPVLDSAFKGNFELQNVALRFNEDEKSLFSNVNLSIKPGQIIGITGGNASGKSSLLYLMMGAMRCSEGQVLIDGQNINDLDPNSVRRRIAYLPQHGVLFNGTILENLTMFKPELEEKALRIARLLGLDDVVARMPLGYDTTVGNGAYDSLPRGIKQRIAIARALMSDPVVLLFDEANAAMDSAGDKVLTEFLDQARGNRTLILVSHRPSLLRMADDVYDLCNGSLQKRDMKDFAFSGNVNSTPPVPENNSNMMSGAPIVVDQPEISEADVIIDYPDTDVVAEATGDFVSDSAETKLKDRLKTKLVPRPKKRAAEKKVTVPGTQPGEEKPKGRRTKSKDKNGPRFKVSDLSLLERLMKSAAEEEKNDLPVQEQKTNDIQAEIKAKVSGESPVSEPEMVQPSEDLVVSKDVEIAEHKPNITESKKVKATFTPKKEKAIFRPKATAKFIPNKPSSGEVKSQPEDNTIESPNDRTERQDD